MATHSLAEVAQEIGASEWTIAELVRRGRVSCIRVSAGESKTGPIRFTDEQVAEVLAAMTVHAKTEVAPRRRKRRVS